MKTQVDKIEISKIVEDLLHNESYYKHKYRSGWICGLGNGYIVYIENHRDELSIRLEHHVNENKLSELIDEVVDIVSQSSTKIEDQLSVDKCKWDELPDEMFLDIAKCKIVHSHETESKRIPQTDIDKAVVNYYKVLDYRFKIS